MRSERFSATRAVVSLSMLMLVRPSLTRLAKRFTHTPAPPNRHAPPAPPPPLRLIPAPPAWLDSYGVAPFPCGLADIIFYVEALSEIGIYPRIVTHKAIDSDFRVFHHTKKVLALMPSSFSFAAKASNDAGGIQGLRIISNRKSMTDAPWWHQCEAVASGSFADVRFREQINTCGNPDDGRPRIPTKWTPIANISMNDVPASIAATYGAATVATTTTSALESA